MKKIDYPEIKPLPEEGGRPFWSVMIPTYNAGEYLEETLRSVLEQAPGPDQMQIEVVDDCSTSDDPEAVVREIGKGWVAFFRQPQNVGAIATFNTCVRRAAGRWVHILHSDDLVLPGFYEAYKRHIETHNCSLVLGRAVVIDENGKWIKISPDLPEVNGLLEDQLWVLSRKNDVRTPSVVVKREVYEKTGGFNEELVHTADWEMWVRAAAIGPAGCLIRPYCLYRVHSSSDTGRLALEGTNVTDGMKALEYIQDILPDPELKKKVKRSVYRWLGGITLFHSWDSAKSGYFKAAMIHTTLRIRLRPFHWASYVNVPLVLAMAFLSMFRRQKR